MKHNYRVMITICTMYVHVNLTHFLIIFHCFRGLVFEETKNVVPIQIKKYTCNGHIQAVFGSPI